MTQKKTPNMHSSWLNVLGDEFEKSYMSSLRSFLKNEKSQNKEIFPPSEKIFSALRLTPLESVKVVIIGQDPYHGKGQANGLAFSVDRGTSIPPSLSNIYKEISSDLSWIEIEYGQVMVFNQNLPHGNRINEESETRWSLNSRFKSVFSPYGDKKLGEFFEPITLRAASRIGMDYQFPEERKRSDK